METEMHQNTFGLADYIVFGLLILISVGIGIFFAFFGKGQKTTLNYFLGDRQLKVVPVALSFVVTFQSSIIILGFPAEAYAYGMQYCIQNIGVMAAYLLATIIVVPVFHPLKVTSVYEYFQIRYGNNIVRFLAVILGMVYYSFYMGIVVFGTALALKSAASVPFWVSVTVFTSAAVLYTSIGGIKAVIWTDVFQSIVMLAGILTVLVKCSIQIGGSDKLFELAKDRFNFFDFNPDPTERHTFWTLVFGSVTQFLHLTVTQAGVQRINSTPSMKTAKRMLYLATPIFSAVWILVMFEGLIIFAYYFKNGCDPLAAGKVQNLNQIVPFTIMDVFRDLPGLPGLFIAALSAASLSTISSGLSSLAAVTYEDVVKIHFANMSERMGTNISKAIVVVFGLLSATIAFLLQNVKGPLGQIMSTFMGAISGPKLGLFLLSIFYRRATTKGAVFGTLLAFSFILWIIIGQNFSGVAKRAPYLPLGPTDMCSNMTLDLKSVNETFAHPISNVTRSYELYDTSLRTMDKTTQMTMVTTAKAESGLHVLYSISYMYFNLLAVIITICAGITVSLFTQPEVPVAVDQRCILPLTVFVPDFLRKKLLSKMRDGYNVTNQSTELDSMMTNSRKPNAMGKNETNEMNSLTGSD